MITVKRDYVAQRHVYRRARGAGNGKTMNAFARPVQLKLGVTGAPSLNFGNDVFDGHTFKQVLAFHRVVTTSDPKLIQEANGVDDAKLLNKGIGSAMG